MKIFLGIPKSKSSINYEKLKQNVFLVLKPYYGIFMQNSINIFFTESTVDLYIMDPAKYANQDNAIISDVKDLFSKLFPEFQSNIKLNYKRLDPNFNPCVLNNNIVTKKNYQNNFASNSSQAQKSEEFDYEKLSENYKAELPRYSFNQVVLPEKVRNHILEAVATIEVEHKVFDEWGLRTIIPNASSAMSFYGPPGTGKSMAAEAIAERLQKKILRATYADIESKFHGEGPKMVKAIFKAAERDDAVLFLDEADSLLSKRLTNVSDGSAQAINSMRSQLLICLEQFRGIVIFATNLVVNYDKAFLSRLINIEFVVPDKDARKLIWHQHLYGKGIKLPLADNINLDELADKYVFCGREIKNAVKDACVTVAISNNDLIQQEDLLKAAEKTKTESERVLKAEDHTKSIVLNDTQKIEIKEAMKKSLSNNNTD